MRNPNRIPIVLNLLGQYWMNNPDLRLGQIVSNINDSKFGISKQRDIFYLEDEELISTLKELAKEK